MKKTAVLIVNLGTPDAPTPSAVRRYLCEFLSDKRVIQRSNWLWKLLLYFVIAPLRSKKSAKAYQEVWQEDGSPLLLYTKRLAEKVQTLMPNTVIVDYAMTYGNPSIKNKLEALRAHQLDEIKILPLYPQYSSTTTGAVIDAVERATRHWSDEIAIEWYHDYATHPAYLQAICDSIQTNWKKHGHMQKLIFSFHGIPEEYIRKGDVYQTRTEASVKTLVKMLRLEDDAYQLCYQSRFGPTKWLGPYTQDTLETLPSKSVESVDIICPGFAVDCLETIEEINMENREAFIGSGGKTFHYIPCLNDSDEHASMVAAIVSDLQPTAQ